MAINNTLNPTKTPARGQPGWVDPIRGPLDRRTAPSSQPVPAPTPVSTPQQVQNPNPVKGLLPPNPSSLSYSGLVGSLAGASSPNKTQTGLIKQSVDAANGNRSIQNQAQDIASQYGQKIADVGGQGARFQAGQLTTGTSPVAEGNAAVTAQSTAAQQQALASGESAALQGVGYQLTGQGQLQSGLNNALGAANTQQGQQITGLNAAAGYGQPNPAAYGQTVFNPLTGQYEGNSGLPDDVMAQYARLAANNQYAAIPSSITGNPVLSAQINAAAQKLNPNYSPIASQAGGNVLSSNIEALGTAQTAGTAQGIQAQAAAPGLGQAQGAQALNAAPGTTQAGQYGQIAGYKSAAQQGQQLASQLSDLLRQFNLNPSDLNAVNSGIQKIAANTSDPHYQALSNYLNDVASRYAQVLTPPGGSATDMTRSIAASMINATASGKSIQQVLQVLDQQAQAVINAVPATGNVPGSTGQYQNGQTKTAGGYHFVFSNGKWVAQ